jgi:mono/diheme cytochrome c family protein
MKSSTIASGRLFAFFGAAALMVSLHCKAGEAPDLTGGELYSEFCASCHGLKGHGDGPVALSLRNGVPDLTLLTRRRGGVFPAEEIHQIIDGRKTRLAHGSSAMPVWGLEFYGFEGEDATRRRRVAELIDHIVEFLRSVQKSDK